MLFQFLCWHRIWFVGHDVIWQCQKRCPNYSLDGFNNFVFRSYFLHCNLVSIYNSSSATNAETETGCQNLRNKSVTKQLLAAKITFILTMLPFVLFKLAEIELEGFDMPLYFTVMLGEVFMIRADVLQVLHCCPRSKAAPSKTIQGGRKMLR